MYVRRIVTIVAIAGLAFAPAVPASHKQDSSYGNGVLLIKNKPSGNVIIHKARDLSVDTGGTRTTSDPTCEGVGGGGGAIRVNGGAGHDFTIALPCEGWRHINDSATSPDYLYRDRTNATCSKVLVRHGRRVKAICRGAQVAYPLDVPPGDIDVTIRMGTFPQRICTTFGPPPTRVLKDGSNGKTYKAKDSSEPPEPCTSSPSGAFLD